MKNKYFILENSSKDAIPELRIVGYIGEYDEVNPKDVEDILSSVSGNKLRLIVNSGGGSMVTGFTIYDMLVNSGLEIETLIVGIAGSMAGVVMLAGSKRTIYKHARVMTHRPKLGMYGEAEQLEALAEQGRDMENQVLDIFKEKTGQEEKVVKSWFKPGIDKWFNANQSVNLGLVHSIVDKEVEEYEPIPQEASEKELVNIYNNLNINNIMSKETLKLDKTLAKKVNMSVDTNTEALVDKVSEQADRIESLEKEVQSYKDKEADGKKSRATNLVENAIKSGKLDASKKESYIKMAIADYDTMKDTIEGIENRKPIHKQINQSTGSASNSSEDRNTWSYKDWAKKDPKGLAEMRANDPEGFAELRKK